MLAFCSHTCKMSLAASCQAPCPFACFNPTVTQQSQYEANQTCLKGNAWTVLAPSDIQGNPNLKQAAVGNAPVLPALASKPAHVAIQVLQKEAPGSGPDSLGLWLGKQLDEGYNIGGVDCVGLLHDWSHTGVHLYNLYMSNMLLTRCSGCALITAWAAATASMPD